MDLATLQEQRDAEQVKLELLELQAINQQIAHQNSEVFMEGFGDFIDPRERWYDDPLFYPTGGPNPGTYYRTQVDDRSDGKFRPMFENEDDLEAIRAQSNRVVMFDEIGIGALESLKDYTLQDGMQFIVSALDDTKVPEATISEMKEAVDQVLHCNKYHGWLDREYHDRARIDGEVLSYITWEDDEPRWHEHEPEHLTEPNKRSQRDLEEWLGTEFPSDWSFGVHTFAGRSDEPLGYHFVFDKEGVEWDYLTADRVVHHKRNVYRKTKRGISDFFPIIRDLERDAKLVENIAEGAALQAAIAWIKEYPEGTKKAGITSSIAGNASFKKKVRNDTGTVDRYVQQYRKGTILNVKGAQYKPGPMGSERNLGFLNVSQHLRRTVGVRFSIPEFMISGDASNANYNSTTITADAFVKARESDQIAFGWPIVELLWKSLKMMADRGKLNLGGMQFRDVMRLVKIKVDGKDPSTKSPLEKRQALAIEVQNGWTSDETAATELGRNFKDEQSKGAERRANPNVAATTGGVDNKEGTGSKVGEDKTMEESLREFWSYP